MTDERDSYLEWRNAPETTDAQPEQAEQPDPASRYQNWRGAQQQQAAERAALLIEQAVPQPNAVAAVERADRARAQGLELSPDILTDATSELSRRIESQTRRAQLANSSRLAGWVAQDPMNAALAQSELQNLSGLSGLVQSGAKGFDQATTGWWNRSRVRTAEDNLAELQTRRADTDRSLGSIVDDVRAEMDVEDFDANIGLTVTKTYATALGRYLSSRLTFADDEQLGRYEEELTAQLDGALQRAATNSERVAGSYGVSANVARVGNVLADVGELEGLSEQVAGLAALIADEPAAFTEWLANVVVQSSPGLIAGTAATLATRKPNVGATVVGVVSGTTGESATFDTLVRDAGYDLTDPAQRAALVNDPAFRRQLRDNAFAYGAVVGLMDAASGGVAGRTLAQSPVGNMALQSITQALMGGSGEALALLASGQDINMVDVLVEGLAEFATAPIEVAGVGGRYLRDRRAVEQDRQFFEALGRSAEESDMRKQVPARYREAVAALTKDGPVETLHVDAQSLEELFQSDAEGVTALDFLSALPDVDIEAYRRALDTGGTFEIPTAVYASDIVGTRFDATVRDYLRTNPEHMSAAELRSYREQLKELSTQAQGAIDRAESGQTDLERVAETARVELVSALRSAGRTNDVAEREALQAVAFARTTAQRMGISMEAFLERYPLADVRGALQSETRAGTPRVTAEGFAAVQATEWGRERTPDDVAEAMDAEGLDAEEATPDEIVAATERYYAGDTLQQDGGLDIEQGVRRLPDLERASPGPVGGVREVASAYMAARGLPVRHQASYVKIDRERAERIAAAYDAMEHAPNDPEVKAAYEALAEETIAQYEALLELGYTFEWINFAETGDPYSSPREAIIDMRENKHLWVFPTDDGFGSSDMDVSDNPLLAMTDYVVDGRKARVNDLFRIVHDVFGHGSEGAAFGARGEENAWQAHVRMFSPLAARAMTTETRGQNSWVNFGPFGEQNRADPKNTVFADQKVGLLPEWVSTVGQAEDLGARRGNVLDGEMVGDGRKFTSFFADVTDGVRQRPARLDKYVPTIDLPVEVKQFADERTPFSGNFEDHIQTSIPGYREMQDAVGFAIAATINEGALLDIGASEGAMAKAIVQRNTKATAIALDPNVSMRSTFDAKPQVGGAEFSLTAFGSADEAGAVAWTEDDGTEIRFFDPAGRKFDVVHEAMVFQFVSNRRGAQVRRVKEMMTRDGLFLTFEKFGGPAETYLANEAKKDAYKSQYYDDATLAAKAAEVLQTGGDAVEGMTDLQVSVAEMEAVLTANFKHVVQVWDSGNFKGFAASDSDVSVTQFLGALPPLGSDFATVQTPREVPRDGGAGALYQAPTRTTPTIPINEDGTITLTHWSDAPRDVLSPSKAGSGPLRGAERNRRGPRKVFFGINVGRSGGYRKESLGSFRHTARVPATDLYDLTADPSAFVSKVPNDVLPMQRMGWIEEQIVAAGFKGYTVSEGPQGMSAALFEDVVPTRVRRDREAARRFSGVDLFDEPMVLDVKNPSVYDIAQGFDDRHHDVFARELDPANDAADYRAVLASMEDELRTQLREPNSGVGWYGKDVGTAMAMASRVYPTLATEQTHRDLFLTFAGIFSNGQTPQQAFMVSAEAFEQFLVDGKVPIKRASQPSWSVRNNNNEAQLRFVEYLVQREGSLEGAMLWLKTPQDRAAIDQTMRDAGFHKKGRYVTKKALAGPPNVGLIAFGEKLGRYTMGLHGFDVDAEDVTIDLWYTRTYRRLIGGLLRGPIGGEGIVSGPNNEDRTVIRRLTKDLSGTFGYGTGDTQALLWFFEKRLWGAQGLRTDEGTNSDGARQLLESKGIFTAEEAASETRDDRGAGDGPREPDRYVEPDYYSDEYFQRRPAGVRGSILLPTEQGRAPVVNLFEGADLSTFLHESGHYYLHVLQDLAARGEQTGSISADWTTINQWWASNIDGVAKDGGVTEAQVRAYLQRGTTGDLDTDRKVNVGLQEQWARAYEAYLMEGKAPSNALRAAFESFGAWLVSVYKRATGLNVNVSDEMRGVFDRLLATDEEIADASRDNGFDKLVAASAEEFGITEEEYQRLVALSVEAQDEAKQNMLAAIMAPIRRARTAEYREERKTVEADIRGKVNAKPANRVREWLGNARWLDGETPTELPEDLRLDRQMLIDEYGQEKLDALPRGRQPIWLTGSGNSADEVADWFGYGSGSEMLDDLITTPKAEDEIKARTDAEMRKRHGDPLSDGSVEEAAVEALHGEKRGQLIAAELRAIGKVAKRGKATTRNQAAEIARRTIRQMPIAKAVRSGQYLAAERRAGERAAMAMARGDKNAAFDAKREQLLNNQLYMESKKADEILSKIESRVASLKKKSVRKNLAGEYLDAIDDILTSYDFRKSVTQRGAQRRAGLLKYVEMMREQGRENELAIPSYVLDEAKRRPYRTLPVNEIEGVLDSLRNIEHTARMKQKLRNAQNERDMTVVVEGIAAEMDANLKDQTRNRVATPAEKRAGGVREFANLLLNADTLLRKLGGFEMGAAYEAIKAPIDAAADWASVQREAAAEKFEQMYAVYDKAETRRMAVRVHYKELGGAYTKWDLISAALNMGNADNMARLMDKDSGVGFNASQIEFIKSKLDKRDWDFVQGSWDYINSFWAQIEARERRLTGVAPKKVQATEVETPYGTYAGGYYPIRYRSDVSGMVAKEEVDAIHMNMTGGKFSKAQTRNGHLEERAQGSGGRELQLGMEVMHQHVGQVIHDLAFSEPVANASRILKDPRVSGAFERKGLLKDHQALELWLYDTATGQMAAGGVFGRLALRAKNGFTLSKLAFNLSTVAIQVTGITQSMVVVGSRNMAHGYSTYLSNPKRTSEEVVAMSPFMRERETTFNRDINDILGDVMVGPAASRAARFQQGMGRVGFWLMQKVQFYGVDVPTWYGGYKQGFDLHGDEVKARAHADRMVARAQASGVFSDRSAFERGTLSHDTRQNGFVRLFTTLGSYMFAKGNIAYEVAGRTRRDMDGMNMKSLSAAIKGATDMTMLFTVEAIAYNLIKGTLPGMGDDDDDESWAAFLAKETALSMMSTMPGIRDFGSSLSGFDAGTYGSVISTFTKPMLQAAQGEADVALFKALSSAGGVMTGLPSGQLNRVVDAWYRDAQGDDVALIEYIMGRR